MRLGMLFLGCVAAAAVTTLLFAAEDNDRDWPMSGKNYSNTRFSGLSQINTQTVAKLKLAWSFDTGVNRGQEAAPIIVGDTMYVVTPFPNYVYALDLRTNGAVKWKFDPKPKPAAQGVACCDVVNRGCAFSNGKIYFNTLDGNTICLEAASGKELWRTELADINRGETITMAPLVVKDKVMVGDSGGEFGVRGWLTALDANTGKIAWRAYHTGPDSECLIGSNFKPFYESDKGKDLGVATWPPEKWKIGGGTVWGFVSYDPETDLIYYGTANPGPWNADARPGDNKWTCGVFARKPESGEAIWFYQWTPHDLFDHDGINENILIDLSIGGKTRKVILHPGRNGYMYVLDRATGEVLSADAYSRVTATKGVDLKSGRPIENPDKKPQLRRAVRDIQPAAPGAKDWQPCAWSPRTQLLYVPHQNLAMDWEVTEANYISGTPYIGVETKYYAGPGGHRGEFAAWDPVKRLKVWTIKENFPVWSGAVVTAGDVAFYGTMEGWFKAVDAKEGKELWKYKTSSGIIGQPVTYQAPDGKQYVAILSGVGGWSGAIVVGDLDPRDSGGAAGFSNAMKDLPQHTQKGGTLYVFSL
jgi:PQQ-dependent dehydrogenase (methanol/ethanol family)